MRAALVCLCALAMLATLALAVGAVAAPGSRTLALEVYLFVVTGLTLLGLLVAVTTAVPPRAAQRPHRRQLEATTLPQLDSITQAVSFAQASAAGLHYRLRPILREVAAARLARRGVALDREPQRARALLGEPAWELVRPDREPGERFEKGWAEADLVKVVEGLESV